MDCKGNKYGLPRIPMDPRFSMKCMTEIDYQRKILDYYDDNIRCCRICGKELADESEDYCKQGPEFSFVGERYGETGFPRILFTRLNPINVKKSDKHAKFFFGSRKSLDEYREQHSGADVKEIFHKYLNGWDSGSYIGLSGAGTITGHSNNSRLSTEDKQKRLRYGIQFIMNKMIEAGIFDKPKNSPLEFCAINNVIKCVGKGKGSNPGGVMFKTCGWYKGELDILKPHILIAFSDKTDNYIHRRFSIDNKTNILELSPTEHCKYFDFPHPLNRGKYSWAGRDIEIPNLDEEPNITFESKVPQRKRLFNYVLYVVKIAKDIKEHALGGQDKP